MEFVLRRMVSARHVALFPAAFNPPTVAHLSLAQAALQHVEEVVFVLARTLPHKEYEGTSLEQRIRMVESAIAHEPRFSLGLASRGLFIEIARECREAINPESIRLLCGRDAAERFFAWPYDESDALSRMLREFSLLTAPRRGILAAPERYAHAVEYLSLDPCDEVSSTVVRERVVSGGDWEDLVPATIRALVRDYYRTSKAEDERREERVENPAR
jgi:nicotinate (nicotinamide) nucleotide adenylyltransferase